MRGEVRGETAAARVHVTPATGEEASAPLKLALMNPLSAHLSKRPAVLAILRRDAAIDLLFSRSRRRVNGNLIPFNGFYRPPLRALSPQSDKTHCGRA